jgi:small-conductance mechanosensitive channel
MRFNKMNIRRVVSIIILVSVSFGLTTGNLCGQPAEIKDLVLKQATLLEDIKKILENHEQNITSLESSIKLLKGELETLEATKEKLIEDKAEVATLDLVIRRKDAIGDRINNLNETIRVKTELKDVASGLAKALEIMSTLTERKNRIIDEAALLPASQFESIQNEIELLKARLEATISSVKEKETNLSTSQSSLDTSRLRLEEEKKKLNDKLKTLSSQKPSTQEESYQIETMKRSLESEIKLRDEKVNLLLVQTELARLNLQSVQIQKLNRQLEIDVKTGIAGILSKKFKEAEAQRKEKEVEEAKKAEEERRRIAEEEKARAELEKKRARKKEDPTVQKQLEETSPEKKRILEVEADVFKQKGLIATIKDELITVGNERHKDRAELKRIQKVIEEIYSGENTPDEVAAGLGVIEAETKVIKDKINTVQSLLAAVEKQKSIISESLKNASAKLMPAVPGEKSSIEKETEGFSDKALGEQLVKLANLRVKHIEEQSNLVETKIDRLNERLELNKVLLDNLTEAQKTISQIRAANVWARRESQISTNTIIVALSDIKDLRTKSVGFYKNSIQNLKKLSIYLSNTKNIPAFTIKVVIIVFVIFLTFFARRYIKRWAKRDIERFTASFPQTFFTFKLIPGLLRVMLDILRAFFLFVISITVSITVPSNAPIVRSFIYGFAIVTVYKLLKGLAVESLSPRRGTKRWVMITYSSVRRIYRGLSTLLLFSAITITIIYVLKAYSYKTDVIELLWFIYRIVTLFLIIWIAVSQRSYLLKILPYPESTLGKLVNKAINLLYPLFIGFIISLFAIRSLGYVLLTYTLITTLVKSMFIAIAAYFAYLYLSRQLLHSQEKRREQLKIPETKELEYEDSKIKNRFRIYKYLLDYGTVIISAIVILGIWNDTFKDVVSSPAAPKLFRDVYERFLYVFISIKNGLTYKFVLAEGRYTTPFKMLFGILVLVAAFIFARYLKKVLQTQFYEKAALEKGAQQAISSGVRYFIIGIAAIIGLNVAGIPLRSLAIFAGAFGIGIGFGMQNIIGNFVSGIILYSERSMRVGDIITLDDGTLGSVDNISIRSTTIITPDNVRLTVPNSKFVEGRVINWSLPTTMIRGNIKVGVAYGSDTDLVKNCLLEVAQQNQRVKSNPEPFVRFDEFGDSALIFKLFYWADNPAERWLAMSEIHFAVDKIFKKNGIEIAFPQRDLHIRSAIPIETKSFTSISKDSDIDLRNPQIYK